MNEGDIHKVVKTMKSNSCGVDEVSAFFIKLSIEHTAKVFADIVNASLKSGRFPNNWKKARIKPIPKISEPMIATDFRPISLLIAFSKIIEKIVCIQMKSYLINNNYFDKFQSAYRQKHSPITALLDITDNIYKSLDESEITILVLLDYSKAFDCANHTLILAKLKSLGFHNSALKWVSSYLSDRSQKVFTEIGESSWIGLKNGVPQGSILGPLFFTILVSDIYKEIQFSKYHLYADDTQLYISGKVSDIVNLIEKLNMDLDRIGKFSKNNFLKLNFDKSVYLIIGSKLNLSKIDNMHLPNIHIDNAIIKRKRKVRNLGIIFDQNLTWNDEINKTISLAYAKLKQASRFKRFLTQNSKKTLVQSYILSQFNYSSVILQNLSSTAMTKIQRCQNMCTRFILNLRKFDHISAGFNSLQMLNMENARKVQSLCLMHKLVQKNAPSYLLEKLTFNENTHNHNTRSRADIHIHHFRTNFGRNCFLNRVGQLYNYISNHLSINKHIAVSTFKLKVKNYFLSLQI